MYILKYCILFTLFFFTTTCFCQSEMASVKTTLGKFKTAIEAKNYSEAISYADSSTISFYDKLLPIVQFADSATLASTPLITKLMVLSFRHSDSTSEIKNFNGKDLLAFAMKKGMITYDNMVGDSIHDILIQNNLAKVITSFRGITSDETLIVQLIKQHGTWEISFITEISYTETLIRRLMQESGKSENEFLFSFLENITGTSPTQQIWHQRY